MQVPVLLLQLVVLEDVHLHCVTVTAILIIPRRPEEDKFFSVYNEPAKCIDTLEIYYSKDIQIKALARTALPPAT